jgi:pSer/pThr/pTyr-binding forkhead associated (FHA) protein
MTTLTPFFIIYRAGIKLREVPISEGQTSIGRRADNQVVIDHLHVSSQHATISRLGNILFIQDAKSTFLNGQRVSRQALKHLDTIEIGPFHLIFHEYRVAEEALQQHKSSQ